MGNIESMTRDILMEELTPDLVKRIAKALEINKHLTSTYALTVSVEDILSTDRNPDPSKSGFYFILEGTRSGVNFFYNNNLEFSRKPNSKSVRVVKRYNNLRGFEESFWLKWAEKWLRNDIVEKIIKKKDGYHVTSEDGKKNLGGPYDTEDEAKKRLQQVHYFKNKNKRVNEDFSGELTYMKDRELLNKFDSLYSQYEKEINDALGVVLRGEPFSRYSRAWRSATIDVDDKRKIKVSLTYEVPDGIYNYIYIIWNAELSEEKGSGNLYGVNYDSFISSKEISKGSHSAYRDGSREKEDGDSLDTMIKKVKNLIGGNAKSKKVNEDYLKTEEDKLSVMSMQDIISELGYDGIVDYRDGKIEADWTTLSQLRRDALNEFDIDLGEIIDESLKINEAPDKYGLPTDDELEQEFADRKAKVAQQRADAIEKEASENTKLTELKSEIKDMFDRNLSKVMPILKRNKLFSGYTLADYNGMDPWYLGFENGDRKLTHSSFGDYHNQCMNIAYNLDTGEVEVEILKGHNVDECIKWFHSSKAPLSLWTIKGEDIEKATNRMINALKDFGVDISGIDGITDISSPSNWRWGCKYYVFSIKNKFYWFEGYADRVYNAPTDHPLDTGIYHFAQIEDPRGLRHIKNTDEYKIIKDFKTVSNFNASRKGRKKIGEAFPWEEDGFFTREDLDEFTAELEDLVSQEVKVKKAYMEPGNMLEVDFEYKGYDETFKVKVDMRKIKLISDLQKKFLPLAKDYIGERVAEIDKEDEELVTEEAGSGITWKEIWNEVKGKYHSKRDQLEAITRLIWTKGYKNINFVDIEDAMAVAMEIQEDMFGWYDPTIEEWDDIKFSLSNLKRKR